MMVLQWVPYIDNYPVLVTYCLFAFFYSVENPYNSEILFYYDFKLISYQISTKHIKLTLTFIIYHYETYE